MVFSLNSFTGLELDVFLGKVVADLERMQRETRIQLEVVTRNDASVSPIKVS